jgi:hypothetical protein
VPHAVPTQPCPATALWTVHVTFAFAVPVTVAKNCVVLGVPDEAGLNAYGGEIATATALDAPEIVIEAVPVREGSAWLVATSITGFGPGAEAGAT